MKKPDLDVPTYNASQFTWHGRHGVVDASDFGPLGTRWHRQVWSDACDTGFVVHSDRTGKDVLFTLVSEEKREGEVVAWKLCSEEGHDITVFND